MKFLSWLKPTTEYFDCAQFDKIAEGAEVALAEKNRYCIRSRLGAKASTNVKARTMRFDRKWFLGLSPKARAAVFVHEMWHVPTWSKKVRGRNWYLVYIFLGLPFLSVGLVAVIYLTTFLLGRAIYLPGLPLLTWPVSVFFGMSYGLRRFSWPIEYECDEASVRFIGLDATKELLRSLKLNTAMTSHPPTRLRLANADRVALKYPSPVLDFEVLEQEIKQEFVYRKA
jgi:hypothetical protein